MTSRRAVEVDCNLSPTCAQRPLTYDSAMRCEGCNRDGRGWRVTDEELPDGPVIPVAEHEAALVAMTDKALTESGSATRAQRAAAFFAVKAERDEALAKLAESIPVSDVLAIIDAQHARWGPYAVAAHDAIDAIRAAIEEAGKS